MKRTEVWTRKYTSTQGAPITEVFRYNRDPEDNIEEDLKKECFPVVPIGISFLWYNHNILYSIKASDDFKETREFGKRPEKSEPYEKRIIIESMPFKSPKELPKGLINLLKEKGFEEEFSLTE